MDGVLSEIRFDGRVSGSGRTLKQPSGVSEGEFETLRPSPEGPPVCVEGLGARVCEFGSLFVHSNWTKVD